MPPAPRPVAREATVAKRATVVATRVRARDTIDADDEEGDDGDDGDDSDDGDDDAEDLVIGT
ncbi:hypothetical protein QP888_02375 [Corynebacterium sp. MSK297]|uniref:hypothetical protein n=1 Tax=Corynebacterium sp. MSK297 TaxID=3050221 RepID=UPI0025513F01|nr:hypothetical protein [Corynebacterium sp. MSK297]MDK8845374.1 hypothetical protein [Corynebacterium sp. MSK297]